MVCREQNRPASALAPFPETLMENKARIHSGEVYDPAKPRLPLAACFDGLPGIATSDTQLTCRVSPLEASSLQQASYRDPPVAAGDRPPPMCLAITSVCSHATAEGYEMWAVSHVEVSGSPVNRAGYLTRSGK